MQPFLALLFISSYCSGISNNTYHVNSSSDLEQYLCNTTWSSQYLVFLLNSSINFTISSGNFCQVTHQISTVIIQSDSPTKSATITCLHNDTAEVTPLPRRGFLFFTSQVMLERLVFKNCGTYLTTIQNTTITDYLNSSSLYYTSSHAAALVFVHCQVNMSQVNIYYSYGFAMIGINLCNSSISKSKAYRSSLSTEVYRQSNESIGSGIILHFFDTLLKDQFQKLVYINISDVGFRYNFDRTSGNQCITDLYHHIQLSSSDNFSFAIINAAALTILYTQKNYSVQVALNQTDFHYNVGGFSSPGGLLIVHYYSSVHTTTVVNNTHFNHNINGGSPLSYCRGSALHFVWFGESMVYNLLNTHQLIVHGVKIFENSGKLIDLLNFGPGAIFIGIVHSTNINIIFSNCTFDSNAAYQEGASMYAVAYEDAFHSGHVSIVLKDIIGKKGFQTLQYLPVSAAGIFSFYRIHLVHIIGVSVFDDNYGSVIVAADTNIYFSGNVTFKNNSGLRGAAIRLQSDSCLHLLKGVSVNFVNNHAQLEGGAIYIGSSDTSNTLRKDCQIIVLDPVDLSMTFYGNTAINAGNSIYIESISECYLNSSADHISSIAEIMKYYEQCFNFDSGSLNHLLPMSTQPSSLVQCNSDNNHRKLKVLYKTYAGQTIRLYLAAVDSLSRNVYSTLRIDVTSKHPIDPYDSNKLWLSHKDKEQIIYEGPNCTSISLAVHSSKNAFVRGELVFSLPRFPSVFNVGVQIKQCPIGFILDIDSGICICSQVFFNDELVDDASVEYQASCDIDNLTIARPRIRRSWAGFFRYANKTLFGVSLICPMEYCNCVPSLSFCSSDNSISLVSPLTGTCENSVPLCLHQRVGPLCGSCGELSVVFGSSECRECSNWWLWTLVLYAVAGPLLIYLLYVLRLTLTTGTLNGIIFYAQAANCGLLSLLTNCNTNNKVIIWFSQLAFTFLSLLNLNLGFSLCFYNGMTEIWKTGLALVFPFYLLTILCIIILFSHCSSRVSNRIADSSVQVLITIVHLCFTKFLLIIIDVFTPGEVFTLNETYKVWYLDGSVEYGIGSHRILMIITLLVVIPLLLPYVLLLVFTRPIRRTRFNEYVRPLLEAIHAPYKEGKEYWFVARLFLLVYFCTVFALYRSNLTLRAYIILLPVFIAFVIIQVYHKPFKSRLVNIIDCSIMYNLTFVSVTGKICVSENEMSNAVVIGVVSVSLVFLILLIVLIYHVLGVTGKIHVLRRIQRALENFSFKFNRLLFSSRSRSRNHDRLLDVSDSFFDPCDYREPLLSSD